MIGFIPAHRLVVWIMDTAGSDELLIVGMLDETIWVVDTAGSDKLLILGVLDETIWVAGSGALLEVTSCLFWGFLTRRSGSSKQSPLY